MDALKNMKIIKYKIGESMENTDLIRKADVFKVIENIKWDNLSPQNFDILHDAIREIYNLPDARQKELEEQEWRSLVHRYKSRLRILDLIKNNPGIPLWKLSSDLGHWSLDIPYIVRNLEEDGIVNCNIQDGKKFCRLTEKGIRLVDEIEEYYEL